ncbi:MAG: TPM domain-containing protein [Ferruginibacter sp.]
MGIFPFFKKKAFFSEPDQARIVEAIRVAEKETSGEIRIYVESKNPFMDPLERAAEIFLKLKMQDTTDRNAVLLYIAMKDHELALYGDEGIHKKVGEEYWSKAVKNMITQFANQNISIGIEQCILQIGQTLKETFPYDASTDKNELSDDMVFGK